MKRFLRVFFSWLVIFSTIIGGGVYLISEKLLPEEKITKVEKPKEELTFLLMGVDALDQKSAKRHRTDTLMLCRYVPETGKIAVLAIPRDTKTLIPGYGETKLNHAHAHGGPELALESVNNLLDINVKYYVRVDYQLVSEVVESLGGVEVDVPMEMSYSDPSSDPPLVIDLEKGLQNLNGKEAMQFLRFRSGYTNQDLGRIESQQQFMKSAMNKAMDPRNVTKVPSILKSGIDNIDTNIPFSQMFSYALDIKNIQAENIQMATVPGDSQRLNGASYFIADGDQTLNLMDKMFYTRELISLEEDDSKENNDYKEEIE